MDNNNNNITPNSTASADQQPNIPTDQQPVMPADQQQPKVLTEYDEAYWQNMKFTLGHTCSRGLCPRGVSRSDHQLNTYDWLADVPGNAESTDLVEVQFKNTRKAYYHNVNGLDLKKGDWVAVEANPGHDVGVVSLTGRLVNLQIKKANLKSADDIRKLFRFAKEADMDRYYEAKSREEATMIQSRQIAKDLGLDMKIGDVEYQGDGNKAIFYYIADERVDFRQLIKVLADTFHVRIEMKQIGARQEAGRIGGTGPCGRELCCATWVKNFSSVSTNAARFQDISPNPQKLAGMCAKLKCCLNYEVDTYMEASKNMPPRDAVLQTQDKDYYCFKMDVLADTVTYVTDRRTASGMEAVSAARANAIIEMNKRGEKPLSLLDDGKVKEPEKPKDMLDGSDLTRFDHSKKKKRKKKKGGSNPSSPGTIATVILAVVMCLMTACSNEGVYYTYQHVNTEGWENDDALKYDIAPADTDGVYSLQVGVRLTADYPYKQLAMIVTEKVIPADRKSADSTQWLTRDLPVMIDVVDAQGKRKGNGPTYYTLETQTLDQLQIQKGDSMHITVRHNMRRVMLPGIADVGVKIIK